VDYAIKNIILYLQKEKFLNSLSKNLAFWGIIILIMIFLFNIFNKPRQTVLDKNYSDFISAMENHRVLEVEIKGKNIAWKDVDDKHYKTFAPEDPEMIKMLRDKRVIINVKNEEENSIWQYLLSWFPMILLIGVFLFFMRQVQIGGGKALSFGKSKARILTKEHHQVTFENVAGIEEAKDELQ
jgi:cell division protease FtsH